MYIQLPLLRALAAYFQFTQRDDAHNEIVLFGYPGCKLWRNAFTLQQREQIRVEKNAHLNRNSVRIRLTFELVNERRRFA